MQTPCFIGQNQFSRVVPKEENEKPTGAIFTNEWKFVAGSHSTLVKTLKNNTSCHEWLLAKKEIKKFAKC